MTATLNERVARDWVGEREWQKGAPYLRDLSSLSVRPVAPGADAGREYRALAHGQEAYRVSVTVQAGRIAAASCSCPVGSNACKHVAALLNKISRDEAGFNELPALDEVLDGLDAPALRRVIKSLLGKHPELEGLLYAQAGLGNSLGEPAPRIRAAFQTAIAHYDHDAQWDSEDGPETEAIEALLLELDQRRAKLPDVDPEEAELLARAYIAVLDGVDSFYEEHDIDYGLDDVQSEGLLGLYDLFVNAELEDEPREDALEAIRNEIASDRIDFDQDEFFDFYVVLTAAEQQSITALLESRSQNASSYLRQKYVQALLDLRGGELTDEDTERLLRAGRDQSQLALFLLARGRVDEAVHSVEGIGGYLPFAELRPAFEQAGALPRLEAIALQRSGNQAEAALLWLQEVYLETGRKTQAYQLALKQAPLTPKTEWFNRLKNVSPDWIKDRDRLIQELQGKLTHRDVLLRLLLSEELVEQAYALVESERTPVTALLAVARQPSLDAQRATLLYIRAAKEVIRQRQRSAYQEAAELLTELIPRLGLAETKTLVQTHLPERQSLPALRDELTKAGLI